ncbi:MAG: aromatic ring-hydroxylating dioxygenase subunit alpha [Actinobacteria bacterium]|nr:aromatic ring-hydroxylating dioxygenase subunit alpha [Actinomycetota bacterium]
MNNSETTRERSDSAGAIRPLASATSLPASYYTSVDQFEVERRSAWTNSWVSVARVEDLVQPGDFVAATIASDPIVVTRGRDGGLNAFANVCPHRGSTIVEGSGTASSLQCPYHNWTFRLDGTLAAAPGMANVDGFDPADMCLRRFAVDVWQGWVFVNLSGDALPLAPQLANLTERVEQYGLEAVKRVASATHDLPVNWKLVVENFAESYHHAAVHPVTLHRDFPGHKSWSITEAGEPWTWLDHESISDEIEAFAVIQIFPAHMFSINRGLGMDWIRVEALGVDLTRVHYEVFLAPDLAENEALIERFNEVAAAVNAEDIVQLKRVQTGLASRWAVTAPLSPLEEGCWHFRKWLIENSQTNPQGEK